MQTLNTIKAASLHSDDFLASMLAPFGCAGEKVLQAVKDAGVELYAVEGTPFNSSFTAPYSKVPVIVIQEDYWQGQPKMTREENFLFGLLHEMGHVCNGRKLLGFKGSMIDEVGAWETAFKLYELCFEQMYPMRLFASAKFSLKTYGVDLMDKKSIQKYRELNEIGDYN